MKWHGWLQGKVNQNCFLGDESEYPGGGGVSRLPVLGIPGSGLPPPAAFPRAASMKTQRKMNLISSGIKVFIHLFFFHYWIKLLSPHTLWLAWDSNSHPGWGYQMASPEKVAVYTLFSIQTPIQQVLKLFIIKGLRTLCIVVIFQSLFSWSNFKFNRSADLKYYPPLFFFFF